MNLYLLETNTPKGYDCVNGFIIRAPSEESARLQASANARDEGPTTWLMEGTSTCTLITARGPTRVLLRDFHAG